MPADFVEFDANAEIGLGIDDGGAGLKIIRRGENFDDDLLAHGKRVGHVEEASIQTDFGGAGMDAEAAVVHFANFGACDEGIAGAAAIVLFVRACAPLVCQNNLCKSRSYLAGFL